MCLNNLNNGNRPQGSLYTACIGLLWLHNKVAQSSRYFKKETESLGRIKCHSILSFMKCFFDTLVQNALKCWQGGFESLKHQVAQLFQRNGETLYSLQRLSFLEVKDYNDAPQQFE